MKSLFLKLLVFVIFSVICTLSMAQKIKVACVGNSITEGAAIEKGKKYPDVLQQLMGEGYEVRNFGLGGRTLLKKGDHPYWNEAKYKEVLQWSPDIVIIKLGTNDSKPQNWKFKSEFEADYKEFVKSFQTLSSRPLIFACLPMPAFEVKWGIDDSVIKNELIPVIKKVSNNISLKTIDLYTPFVGKGNLTYDAIHPNAEGAALMAQLIYKNLNLNVSYLSDPLAVVKLIADKLIRTTPFSYRLEFAPVNSTFNGMQFVDFGRTFSPTQPSIAYAFTHLNASEKTEMKLSVEHNDGCKIWVNDKLVYEKKGDHKINLSFQERSIELPNEFTISLEKGVNTLLIKSENRGNEKWMVYLQPPTTKGAVISTQVNYPQIGLSTVPNIDSKIAQLTNWLVVGPFKNQVNSPQAGIDVVYPPEKQAFQIGSMYDGIDNLVTWTIPKLEVLGNLIDPLPWGTNYQWNYHNGGVAWAMQKLAEVTSEQKYATYSTNYCEYHLNGIPFVNYQIKTLNAFNSANNQIVETPLLDFTLAPSLPFIYKLRTDNSAFQLRSQYEEFMDKMIKYARFEQVRLPESNIYTRLTPEKYTTWVDDMFMGIPFLMQAALYTKDKTIQNQLFDDAANQIIRYNEQVWDKEANLYMHAHYSNKRVKLPHWSRANGWGIWATTEVLLNLPKNHPQYKAILNHYKIHVQSLVKLQDKNSGFWHNVLDRADSPEEVSGTAIFTMAIARGISNGWLNRKEFEPVVVKAWEALKTQIEPEGTVHKICMGTMCSEDVNYYMTRPFYDNDTHGLFAVLFAGIEVANMLNTKK